MPEVKRSTSQMLNVAELEGEEGVAKIIEHAVGMRCSDLMILANEDFYSIQVRHLGMTKPIAIVSAEQGKRFTQTIKAQAGMDVAEHRRPHDGRWIYESDKGEEDEDRIVDLRISCVPTLNGEDMVIRLLSRSYGLIPLDEIGLTRQALNDFRYMLDSPGGLVLCCGPTGSGKSATLYAALRYLNDGTKKINTIEDPVEFAIDGLRQSQIRTQIGLHFAELLKGMLRQAPDIIMIGEIRDQETARTAVHAANSGHLVLSTIHAPVAAAAIESMRSLGVNNHFLSTALRGILSQRLVRTLDPKNRVEFDISHAPQIFEPIQHLLKGDEGKTFYAPGTGEGVEGYNGRTGVFEVMRMSNTLRDMVGNGVDTGKIREQAQTEGMLDFKAAALLKVAQGVTSTEEVFRVIPTEYLEED